MGKSFSLTAVLALAALPFGLHAQDAATEPADTTTPSAGELSLGTPESGEPQVGQTYVVETFTDWEQRCVRTANGADPCQLYQLLSDGAGNPVAEFNIFNLPEGQEAVAGATVITPLETLLTAELRLAIDGGQPKRYPFSFCTQIGCYARLGFTAEDIDQFKRGASATITIVAAAQPGEPVDLGLSLSGFTAGWTALSEAE